MSKSAEGTEGKIVPASLNVDAEMANSQTESLVQVASKAASYAHGGICSIHAATPGMAARPRRHKLLVQQVW